MSTLRNSRARSSLDMHTDFVEADLDQGFTLVQDAESCLAIGHREDALRKLREAANLLADGERRLFGITNDQAWHLRRELDRLRTAIDGVNRRMTSSLRIRHAGVRPV